ncbi:MAG TPA: hypothetical protein VFB38_08025 [Chthonomonadaceae bacterium]|nr:hypothetical protein [Chthonomonadaceae bacterium]
MTYWMAGARRTARSSGKAAAKHSPASAIPAVRRGRRQFGLMVIGAVGVLVGMRMGPAHRGAQAPAWTERTLAGTWELQSIKGDPVGPNADSVILSQRVTFQAGKLTGETHLRANTDAATTAMPFPDQSVRKVIPGALSQDVTVTWDGTYKLLDRNRIELQIGKANYRAAVTLNPQAHTMEADHDIILTYPGPARYRSLPQR